MRPIRTIAACLLAVMLAAACTNDSTDPSASGTTVREPGQTAPAGVPEPDTTTAGDQRQEPGATGDTTGSVEWPSGPRHRASAGATARLVEVRAARHPGFDRVVLEFTGPVPGYDIRYVPEVIADGSGQLVTLEGRAFLSVVLRETDAHDASGSPTVPRTLTPRLPALRQAKLAGDFEGVVTVALGLDDTTGYRVLELTGPSRIAIDVAS